MMASWDKSRGKHIETIYLWREKWCLGKKGNKRHWGYLRVERRRRVMIKKLPTRYCAYHTGDKIICTPTHPQHTIYVEGKPTHLPLKLK